MPDLNPKQKRFVAEYVNADRFWSYVDQSGGPDACWPFQGALVDGYGRFHIGISANSSMAAHRIAYGLTTGDAPPCVRHGCDNPPCCNPAHLLGGTKADNNRDMMERGRHFLQIDPTRSTKGEDHGHAKLTDEEVKRIRGEYAAGGKTQRDLARAFNVCQRTVNKVVNRTGWAHV